MSKNNPHTPTPAQQPGPSNLIDVPTVAKILNASPRVVHRLIKGGHIPSVRIGSLVRVPADALDRLISGG